MHLFTSPGEFNLRRSRGFSKPPLNFRNKCSAAWRSRCLYCGRLSGGMCRLHPARTVQEAHNHQHPSLTPDQQVSDAVEADKSRAADVFRRVLGARERGVASSRALSASVGANSLEGEARQRAGDARVVANASNAAADRLNGVHDAAHTLLLIFHRRSDYLRRRAEHSVDDNVAGEFRRQPKDQIRTDVRRQNFFRSGRDTRNESCNVGRRQGERYE